MFIQAQHDFADELVAQLSGELEAMTSLAEGRAVGSQTRPISFCQISTKRIAGEPKPPAGPPPDASTTPQVRIAGEPKQPAAPPPDASARRGQKRDRSEIEGNDDNSWPSSSSEKSATPSGWLEKAAAISYSAEQGRWRDVEHWIEEFKWNTQFQNALRRAQVNDWKPRWS